MNQTIKESAYIQSHPHTTSSLYLFSFGDQSELLFRQIFRLLVFALVLVDFDFVGGAERIFDAAWIRRVRHRVGRYDERTVGRSSGVVAVERSKRARCWEARSQKLLSLLTASTGSSERRKWAGWQISGAAIFWARIGSAPAATDAKLCTLAIRKFIGHATNIKHQANKGHFRNTILLLCLRWKMETQRLCCY